ncbi:glutaredoxin [Sporanaerobium hydrogeniformans]|uniref:Glutaredoxin n=1 Tax=Sporanaerobium hydrogeniformans TaxID=3072179 RepID=A0AC61DA22_9FIRM|nr:arsenate reductase family protein [Sporanaerobium hydrogeniformans]PHV69442.1 glutaredoxin [Sporanaerobium hydrogeniformans]
MKPLFLHYPKCTTCKRALTSLKSLGIDVEERHIVENHPTNEELTAWIKQSGLEVKKFFNTSGNLYKELKLKDKLPTLSQEEAIALLSTHGMLVKRPLLITDDIIVVGFKEESYKQLATH